MCESMPEIPGSRANLQLLPDSPPGLRQDSYYRPNHYAKGPSQSLEPRRNPTYDPARDVFGFGEGSGRDAFVFMLATARYRAVSTSLSKRSSERRLARRISNHRGTGWVSLSHSDATAWIRRTAKATRVSVEWLNAESVAGNRLSFCRAHI